MPLESGDLEDLVDFGLQTIWQYNFLLDKELADLGRSLYIPKILKEGTSFALKEGTQIKGYILSSIPKWDSDFLGFDSYVVRDIQYDSHHTLKLLLNHLDEILLDRKIRYCYVRVSSESMDTIRSFENNGFTLADIRAMFNRNLHNEPSFPQVHRGLHFELANEEDTEEIALLSKAVSKQDRFHGDPNFPQDRADELYYQWVINGAKSGKDTVKCVVDGEIVGFHMSYPEKYVQKDNISPLSISDLMGVHPKCGGKGIGTGLFINYFALAESIGCKHVMAGVHFDNVISLRLHEGVGFKVFFTEVGLRKWFNHQ
ncbi:MAG: GNAT family N-acetyltransferase [Candidatus Thorarchaeota archaeon]